MSFSRVNPSGWPTGSRLTSTQMNNLDINHANAVDGDAGGTYTPSAPIIIDGFGVELPGGIGGSVSVGTNITAGGSISASGSISAAGNVTTTTGTVTAANLSVTTAATVASLLATRLRFSAAAGPNSNVDILVGTHANILIADVTAPRTYNVRNTGAQTGDWFLIQNLSAAFGVGVEREFVSMGTLTSGRCVFMVFVGGTWQYVSFDTEF